MELGVGLYFFLAVASAAMFTFLAVNAFTEARTEERKEFYLHETIRRISELDTESARDALEHLRERERAKLRKERDGYTLGGIITSLVGVALLIFLNSVGAPNYVGVIPLFVGIGLLVYVRYFAEPVEGGRPFRDDLP